MGAKYAKAVRRRSVNGVPILKTAILEQAEDLNVRPVGTRVHSAVKPIVSVIRGESWPHSTAWSSTRAPDGSMCSCGLPAGGRHADACTEWANGPLDYRRACELLHQHQASAGPFPLLCEHAGCRALALLGRDCDCWTGRAWCCGCCADCN